MKSIKKLQLITIILLIITILIMIIGLVLIGFCDFHNCIIKVSKFKVEITEENGFKLLNTTSINYVLSHSACSVSKNIGTYSHWIQLQSGVIFCTILTPIFTFITTALTFLTIGFKMKFKNNNFWDAIKNCEIINNYYLH
ncbi:hypothetical protein [Spiroplasma endosymbiont of Nebria brevicollis]|uniref:hypothetical protein n=1 Tax=Spiroplasma endosymbiont of Nebria brevicollis TaxID=3066284 RepID=UPI00313D408C